MKIIANIQDVEKNLPPSWAEAFSPRRKAIETYVSKGGIIKIGDVKGNWPRLIYPTRKKLEEEIRETEAELSRVRKQLKDMRAKLKDIGGGPMSKIRTMLDPLYWRHNVKLLLDPDYKEVYELVRPPMHLMHKPEWKRKLLMFVKSQDYRMRLKEARLSEIGRKREVMEVEVRKRMDFSRQVVSGVLEKFETKERELSERLSALRALLSWAKAS